MNFDKFTIKAQEAVQSAQNLAQELGHQQLDGEHLALALVQQQDSLIPQLLQRLGVALPRLTQDLQAELGRRLKVSGGGQLYPSPEFQQILQAAPTEASRLKDDFTSTEHLLLALIDKGGSTLRKILSSLGVTRDGVLKALVEIRGNQRVTDQNPEEKFQALEKYGRDLTALARQGKIDPVIGRDDEIRREIGRAHV